MRRPRLKAGRCHAGSACKSQLLEDLAPSGLVVASSDDFKQSIEGMSSGLDGGGESIEKARSKLEKFRGFLLAAFC